MKPVLVFLENVRLCPVHLVATVSSLLSLLWCHLLSAWWPWIMVVFTACREQNRHADLHLWASVLLWKQAKLLLWVSLPLAWQLAFLGDGAIQFLSILILRLISHRTDRARLAGQQAHGSSCLSLSLVLGLYRPALLCKIFFIGSGGSNSGLHTCVASTLPTEPFPQSVFIFWKYRLQQRCTYCISFGCQIS